MVWTIIMAHNYIYISISISNRPYHNWFICYQYINISLIAGI